MLIYRIENNNVVTRDSDEVLTGWTECEYTPDGELIFDSVATELQRLKTEAVELLQYKQDRAEAYPSLTEQADMAYWDRQNGTTTLDDAITAVKEAHPKPTA